LKDTSDKIDKKFREMLLIRPGEERLKMGCSMHAAARALVVGSIAEKDRFAIKRELFLRFYGGEFGSKERKKILAVLRKAAGHNGKSQRRSKKKDKNGP